MSTQPEFRLTPEEYLTRERSASYRSEYLAGETFAMAGADREHILLVQNLFRALDSQLADGCFVYTTDMRVHIPATGLFTYPDLSAACNERFLDARPDTLLNPTLIAEVLSPSTEAYDRGRKFEHYRRIESLQQYMLVSQDRVHVDLYTRQPSGLWLMASFTELSDIVDLVSMGCTVTLADVYRRLPFASITG